MKVKIMNQEATEKGTLQLPEQFSEEVRSDLIQRAVLAIQANNRTPYGTFPMAGKRPNSYISKRRRDYKTTYGFGQSRTPRKVMSKSGTRMSWVGAFVPQAVGGRPAHPPKSWKSWEQKINESENRKAIRSALAATMDAKLVEKRGHKLSKEYPFILSNDFEKINKTANLVSSLQKLGFENELERASQTKIRAGKGKSRGRRLKSKTSILFVVGNNCDLLKSARNLKGSDVVEVQNLNAELLAPGAVPGRLTLFTESAIEALSKNKLFTQNFKGTTQVQSKQSFSAGSQVNLKEQKIAKKTATKKVAKKSE